MDVKDYPSLLSRTASEDKEIKKLKEIIRTEVTGTCKRGGCYVDRVISSKDLSLPLNYDSLGHTLLHLSVYYELVDSIEELLSVGARTDICDKFGITAYELALETGNQEVVFKMARRESYQNYLHFIEKYNTVLECKNDDDSDDDQDDRWKVDGNSLRRKVDFYNQSKMLEWDENVEKSRYDDYLLWTDSTRSFHLTKLLSTLEDRERLLNASSRELIKRKLSSASLMQEMHEKLREKEHSYSLQIFDNIKLWRSFRRKLLRLTDKVNHIKAVLEEARRKCFWRRDVNFRHYSGLVLKFWTVCEMTLTGEYITLLEITDESATSKSSVPDDDEAVAPVDKSTSSHQEACSGDEKSHLVKSNSDDFSWQGSIGYAEDRLGRTERTRSAASASSAISDEQAGFSKEGSERSSEDPEVASIAVENKRAHVGRRFMRRNKKTIERSIPLETITEVEIRFSSHKKSKGAGSKMKPQVADITITYMDAKDNRSTGKSDANSGTGEGLANRKGSVDYIQSTVDLKSVHRGKVSKIVIQLRSTNSSSEGHRSSLTQRDSLNSATSTDGMDLTEQIQDFEYKLRNLTKGGQVTISYSDSSNKNGKFSAGNSFSSAVAKGSGSLPAESNKMDVPTYSSGMDDTDLDQSDGKNIISDGDDNHSHSRSYNSSTMALELHSHIRAIDSFAEEKRPLESTMFCTHRSQSYCSGRSHHRSVRRHQQKLKQKKPIETSSSVRSADFSVSYSSSGSRMSHGKGKGPPKSSNGDESSTRIQSSCCNDGRSSVSGLTSIESGDLSANSSTSTQDIDRLLLKLLNSASASGALSGLDPSLIDISTLSQSYSAGLSSLMPSSLRLYLEGDKTVADASQCQDIESIKRILMELTTSARDGDGILESILLSIGRCKAECESSFSRTLQVPEKDNTNPKSSQKINYGDKFMRLCPLSESKKAPARRSDDKKSLINLISKRSTTSCEIISMLETKISKYRTERNFYWTRLEEVINTREHLLECLRYLRSLRFVISNPPSSPTSTLSSTMSSMEEVLDKVTSLHDNCESPHRSSRRSRDLRYYQHTLSDSMCSQEHVAGVYSTLSVEDVTDIKSRLSLDRSEEIRLSLLTTNAIAITKTWSPSPGGVTSPVTNTFMSTPLPGIKEGSLPSTLSTVRPSPWKVSIETQQYQQSLIQRRMLQNTVQHSAEKLKKVNSLPSSPATIKKVLFDEKVSQFDSPERTEPPTAGHEDGNLPTERSKNENGKGSDRKKDGSSPRGCYPLNLGIPPEGCGEDLQNVVGLLRDLWDCELRSFEAVGRLTELFVLREETVKKINELAEKEKKPPPQSELFDIQL